MQGTPLNTEIGLVSDPACISPTYQQKTALRWESESGRKLTEQTQYDWNIAHDSMKAQNGIYSSGDIQNIWDKPGKNTKENIIMKGEKGFYTRGRLQLSKKSGRHHPGERQHTSREVI